MKVSSLVIERADLQRRFAEQASRLLQIAKRQESDSQPETEAPFLRLMVIAESIRDLTVQINEANVANGNMGRIAIRDELDRKLKVLRDLLNAARVSEMRSRPTEIRWVANFDIVALEERIDSLSRDRRTVNEAIQSTDWSETS